MKSGVHIDTLLVWLTVMLASFTYVDFVDFVNAYVETLAMTFACKFSLKSGI